MDLHFTVFIVVPKDFNFRVEGAIIFDSTAIILSAISIGAFIIDFNAYSILPSDLMSALIPFTHLESFHIFAFDHCINRSNLNALVAFINLLVFVFLIVER